MHIYTAKCPIMMKYTPLLCENISKSVKFPPKRRKRVDRSATASYNMKKLIEVAEAISSSRHAPASGRKRKAIPPKLQFDCRRFAVGAAFKRCGTVTQICVEGYQRCFYYFRNKKPVIPFRGRRLILLHFLRRCLK